MSEMTCDEFQAFVARALSRFVADWRDANAVDGETFPERLQVEDWWQDFSAVTECDVVENGDRGRPSRRRPGAPPPMAADARSH